jgi:hypothetical protein
VIGFLTAILLASAASTSFQDAWIRFELPKGWSIEGESGEYMLESEEEDEEDVASLLILPSDPERSMEELLADIEEQFLSTGLFAIDSSEERDVNGTPVHLRRYRRMAAEGDSTESIHTQYIFWRSNVQVLLQVEAAEKSAAPERLFTKIFETLEILSVPEPFFYEDFWGDPALEEAIPDGAVIPDDDVPAEEEDPPDMNDA